MRIDQQFLCDVWRSIYNLKYWAIKGEKKGEKKGCSSTVWNIAHVDTPTIVYQSKI